MASLWIFVYALIACLLTVAMVVLVGGLVQLAVRAIVWASRLGRG